MMARKAMSQIQSAKVGVEKFRYIGPQGKRIIKAEMDMLMNSISSARRPEVSEALAQKAEAKLQAQQQSNREGATIVSITADEYFERIAAAFSGRIMDMINNTSETIFNPLGMDRGSAYDRFQSTQGASNP